MNPFQLIFPLIKTGERTAKSAWETQQSSDRERNIKYMIFCRFWFFLNIWNSLKKVWLDQRFRLSSNLVENEKDRVGHLISEERSKRCVFGGKCGTFQALTKISRGCWISSLNTKCPKMAKYWLCERSSGKARGIPTEISAEARIEELQREAKLSTPVKGKRNSPYRAWVLRLARPTGRICISLYSHHFIWLDQTLNTPEDFPQKQNISYLILEFAMIFPSTNQVIRRAPLIHSLFCNVCQQRFSGNSWFSQCVV